MAYMVETFVDTEHFLTEIQMSTKINHGKYVNIYIYIYIYIMV